MTVKKLRNNGEAYKQVDKREVYEGSSTHGDTYNEGSAPWLGATSSWLSEYETDVYRRLRHRVTYIVWSFYTPIAYYVEGMGWYKVGQTFSSFTSRHKNGALRNVTGHTTATMTGDRGDWTVTCPVPDCWGERHFTVRADAERVFYNHR